MGYPVIYIHKQIKKNVLSTFLYASELRTLDKQMEDKINAFKMWIFQCMFKISHLDRKTNVEVLDMAMAKKNTSEEYTREETTIFWTPDTRKVKTKKLLMEGKTEGTRYRGRQRSSWTSDVTDWCGMSYTKCVRVAEGRKE